MINGKNKFRVIYISPHVDGYGADRSLLNNVIYLKSLGVAPLFIVPKKGLLTEYLTANNIPFFIANYTNWTKGRSKNKHIINLRAFAKLFKNFFLALKVYLQLRRTKAAIVHTNDLITNFGILLSWLLGCKHIMHSRCLLHESGIEFEFGTRRSLAVVAKHSAFIIFNSETVYDYYRHFSGSVKTQIIHSAIFKKSERTQKAKGKNAADRPVEFIFIGRYEPQKDPLTILKAASVLAQKGVTKFRVSFFGKIDRNSEDYIKKMAALIQNEHIGEYISINDFDKKIGEKLGFYDVGLFTSPMEGIARVIIEYMIHALPVIGTNAGAVSHLVLHNTNGLLFEASNAQDLAHKMEAFITDRALISKMGMAAYKNVGDQFSVEYTSEHIFKIYQSALASANEV